MESTEKDFIEFALNSGVLELGEFTLKSGAKSPYFFNTGSFASGETCARLGTFYAATIAHAMTHEELEFDMLFGSAYKGIPIVCATAIALQQGFGINKEFAFNRKEIKGHGEGGHIIGAAMQGRVLIMDDVISSGMTINESVQLVYQYEAKPAGIVIAFDREEKDPASSRRTVCESIVNQSGLQIFRIASLSGLIQVLRGKDEPNAQQHLNKLLAYRAA